MEILDKAELCADASPKKAFYRIWIARDDEGTFVVEKESGALGKVLDKRSWKYEDEKRAREFFRRKVKEKTNPQRKSPRIYKHAV